MRTGLILLLGGASIYFLPASALDVTGSVRLFGARTTLSLGTVYGPAQSDGFVNVFGRADGNSGLMTLSVVADTNSSPSTERGIGYSYNNGNYLSNVQLMVPVRKGEYYQVQCGGSASCPGGFLVGVLNAYFTPLGQ